MGDYQRAAEILQPIAEAPRQRDHVAEFFMATLYENGYRVLRPWCAPARCTRGPRQVVHSSIRRMTSFVAFCDPCGRKTSKTACCCRMSASVTASTL